MSADDNSPSRYEVVWLQQARQQLNGLKQKALLEFKPVRLHFASQLKTILRALEYVPLEWSEPIDQIPSLGLINCLGFHERHVVNIGVHEEQRVVFVRSIRALSGHFLADE